MYRKLIYTETYQILFTKIHELFLFFATCGYSSNKIRKLTFLSLDNLPNTQILYP